MSLLARLDSGDVLARVTVPDSPGTSMSQYVSNVPRLPGIHLDHYTALGVAAHFACVQVISKNLAQCAWEIVEERPNGDWEYRPSAPAYRIFNVAGNDEMIAQDAKEQALLVALLWGASYAEIEWDMARRPRGIWPLEPERCCPERNEEGRKVLRVKNWSREDTILDWKDVFTIQGPGVGFYPFDMVVLASRTIAQALAADVFGLKFYQHGTQMGGVLTTDNPTITKKQLQDLIADIEKGNAGPENAFRFLALSHGLKLQPWNQSLKDAEASEHRHLIIEEICRFYGVPPHKIAHLLRSTNNNIEHQGLEYTRDTLGRWARKCEQEVKVKMLGGSRLRMQIDMDELSEGDAKSVAETDSILVNSGLRRRNELRRKRGWNSYGPVGDIITVQGAMTTLEAVADAPAPRRNGESAPAEVGPDTRRQAAVALYANALKRSMRRQYHRANQFASKAASAANFRKQLDEIKPEQQSYLLAQLDEVMHVVHSIGMNGNAEAVRREALRSSEEDMALLTAAFMKKNLATWCDIEERAAEIASELVDAK